MTKNSLLANAKIIFPHWKTMKDYFSIFSICKSLHVFMSFHTGGIQLLHTISWVWLHLYTSVIYVLGSFPVSITVQDDTAWPILFLAIAMYFPSSSTVQSSIDNIHWPLWNSIPGKEFYFPRFCNGLDPYSSIPAVCISLTLCPRLLLLFFLYSVALKRDFMLITAIEHLSTMVVESEG